MKGVALHCGRYGCIIRLANGRLANMPADDPAYGLVREALAAQRRPEFEFDVSADVWPQLRFIRECNAAPQDVVLERSSSPTQPSNSLDEKIIDYLRQTADWDPTGAMASRAYEQKKSRAERLSTASEVRERRRAGAKRASQKKRA